MSRTRCSCKGRSADLEKNGGKKCSTGQRFIFFGSISYEIHILVITETNSLTLFFSRLCARNFSFSTICQFSFYSWTLTQSKYVPSLAFCDTFIANFKRCLTHCKQFCRFHIDFDQSPGVT